MVYCGSSEWLWIQTGIYRLRTVKSFPNILLQPKRRLTSISSRYQRFSSTFMDFPFRFSLYPSLSVELEGYSRLMRLFKKTLNTKWDLHVAYRKVISQYATSTQKETNTINSQLINVGALAVPLSARFFFLGSIEVMGLVTFLSRFP